MSSSTPASIRSMLRLRSRGPILSRQVVQRRCASESSWDPRLHPSGLKPAAQGDAEAAESSKPAKGKPAGGNETTKSPATSTSHPSGSALPKPRLDFKKITAQAEATTLNAILRRAPVPRDTVFHITRLYETSLTLRRKIDAVKHQQRDIGLAIKAGGGAAAVEQARKLKGKVGEYVAVLEETERELMELGLRLPNDTYPGTPVGSEAHAIELERLGRPVTKEEETAGPDPMRDHLVIAEHWDWIDPPASAISTGTSWPYLKSTLALLEQSLVQYAMSVAVAEGWTPVVVPDVVKEDVMVRCGFTPRDPSQVGQTYYVSTAPRGTEDQGTGGNLVLGATAEIPLAALSANKILPPTALPIKYVGVSHSFRAEAGARGADTRGLYRLHQFTKVELFAVTGHEDPASGGMMSQILALQKRVVRGLGLSVRVVEMPTEELGAPAWRKVDMEAWMPGRGKWGEISSTSDCRDYQSRRLHIRYRPHATSTTSESLPFAHTLNGTCAAIPRLLIALLENGVILENGKPAGVRLPSVLKRFWYAGDTVGEGEREGRIEWV